MAKQSGRVPVLLVTDDPLVNQELSKKIDLINDYILISQENQIGDLNKWIKSAQPEVLLLDFNYSEDNILDLIDQLVLSFPSIPIVVIIGPENIQNSNSVVLSGARAFITTPIDQKILENTLNRVLELSSRFSHRGDDISAPLKEEHILGETFVVFSPKGGVGCTTLATNLAISLRKHYDNVLLIDGKFLFGHVSLALNIRTANSIIDLLGHANNLDEGLIRQVALPHSSGIDVLPAPNSLSEGQGIRPNELFNVLKAVKQVYDVIIIDAGNYLDENTVTLMDAATYVLVVLTPEIASMRDTRKYLDLTRSLGYPKSKLKLILNKTERRSEMHKNEIERVIKSPVIGSIPSDTNVMPSSMNEGIPIVIKKHRHEICRAFSQLAKELSKLPKKVDQPDTDSTLQQSSQFG